MLVIAEHDDTLKRTDDPRSYYIVAGAGLRLDMTRTEHVQFAPVAVQALFAAVAELPLVAAVTVHVLLAAVAEMQRRSQDFCLGATRPMSPGTFSVISEADQFQWGGGVVAEIRNFP